MLFETEIQEFAENLQETMLTFKFYNWIACSVLFLTIKELSTKSFYGSKVCHQRRTFC